MKMFRIGQVMVLFDRRSNRVCYVVQMVKYLSAMQDTRILSLGQEDLLEKKMATHSSILVWIIPWREEPGRV